ncbi:MAG: hypothetical protein HOP08_01105 [Cyclobacteriaceae bacterium]|nr:hypothetical protein [Cyclobacteriaceae bacterium]
MRYQSSMFCSHLLAVFLFMLVSGCYYDKEKILYPGEATCVAVTNPTFNATVLPMLTTNCNNCHGGTSPSGGIKLDTYLEVSKYVKSGSLIGSINYTGGFSPMPKGGNKMSACQIKQIQDWITAGALNN